MKLAVAGHQNLGSEETKKWIAEQLLKVVMEWQPKHAGTCLAEGSEQLFAEVLIKTGTPYTAYLPCRNYTDTFTAPGALARFGHYFSAATHTQKLPFVSVTPTVLFNARKRMVRQCDRLILIWDGTKSTRVGSISELLHYAMGKRKEVFHLNPEAMTTTLITPPESRRK